MASWTLPSVTDFKTYFVRDFPYGSAANQVNDIDVTNAMQTMAAFVNQALYQTQNSFTIGALNLAAHYLVMSLRASSQGIAGNYAWPNTGKGVETVNESFTIPEAILENPQLAMLCKTYYGANFVLGIYDQLRGQAIYVIGGANP